MALPTVSTGIAVAPLLALCQCLFFNLSALDNAAPGPDAGDDAPAIDSSAADPWAPDAGPEVEASAELLDGGADVVVEAADLDVAIDEGRNRAGLDGSADQGGGLDAPVDAMRDALAIDASVNSGGIAAGLTTFYPFAETTSATSADASGNNRTATMQGATFAVGVRNNAAAMNGNGQYVSLPADVVGGVVAFTISTWVNLSTSLVHSHIFDFGTGGSRYMFLTPHSGSNTTQFAITTTGFAGEQALDATALSTGSWQHVCITLSGITGTLYVNGKQVAQNASMTLNPASLGSTTQNTLGSSRFGADPYLNGKIDEFRIYNRALSASEVQQLWQQLM